MLKLNRSEFSLSPVVTKTLAQAGIREREDLHRLIAASPAAFCHEVGEELLLLGEQVEAWTSGGERIDLLALARDGALVVVELKRGAEPYQLLQGVSHAAVVSKWAAGRAAEELARWRRCTVEQAQAAIDDFLTPDAGNVNHRQRVLLVAERFDPVVLATGEWLVKQHGVELRCHRVSLYNDGGTEYLVVARVFPLEEALPADDPQTLAPAFTTWTDVLAGVRNEHVKSFFLENKDPLGHRESFVKSRTIVWRVHGKTRMSVAARADVAYAWQTGRFEGDVSFWQDLVSDPAEVEPQSQNTALRFYLRTAEDFERFRAAMDGDFLSKFFLIQFAQDIPSSRSETDRADHADGLVGASAEE